MAALDPRAYTHDEIELMRRAIALIREDRQIPPVEGEVMPPDQQ
jgi:hypothetical protein